MNNEPITKKRRVQIFLIGLAPLLTLCAILTMTAQFELDLVDLFTKVEKREAGNYVVVTKAMGVPIKSRPATDADMNRDAATDHGLKIVILLGSIFIVGGSIMICYAASTGRPAWILCWCNKQLEEANQAKQKRKVA